MLLTTTKEKDLLVVTLTTKEASLKNSEEFKTAMSQFLEEGHKKIVVDFRDVNYVDSSFLGALVSSLKLAMANHAEMFLSNLNKDVYNLLQLIRIDKVFTIYKDNEEALKQSHN